MACVTTGDGAIVFGAITGTGGDLALTASFPTTRFVTGAEVFVGLAATGFFVADGLAAAELAFAVAADF